MAGFWTRPIRETMAMSDHAKTRHVGEWANARADARDTRVVSKQRKQTSHLFHLVMTICTGGLWGLVWIGMIVWHHVGPRAKTVTRVPA